jgi:uncharacterized protein YrzB (UPF0473 family)
MSEYAPAFCDLGAKYPNADIENKCNEKEALLMEDERDDIVILVDENGDEVEFEHIDTIEMNGNEYVVLAALEEEESEEKDEEEVVILKIEHSEDGEDSFVTIDDDDELDDVFEEFQARMEEEFGSDE